LARATKEKSMRPQFMTALLCTLPLLAAGCSTMGHGSQTPVVDRISSTGQIRIGMAGDYPPMNARTKSGTIIGLDADLAGALASILQVELVLIEKPFKELLPAVESGEIDVAISGITMTPRRNLKVAFAGPYFVSSKAILAKADTLANVTSVADLNSGDLKLVAVAGGTSQELVEQSAPNATHIWSNTQDEAVQALVDGTADALVADVSVCAFAMLRNPDVDLALVESKVASEPIGIAIPAGDPLFLNLVENYLRSLEQIGLLRALRTKWFQDPSWIAMLP
jgi:polar amino acid transport system substrate-binding protein